MTHILVKTVPIGAIVFALLLTATATTSSQASVRWGACGTPTRVAGKGVQCGNGFTYDFNVTAPAQNWVVRLTVPLTQCAPVRFDVELDGKKVATTSVLKAGKSEIVKLSDKLSPGTHKATIKVQVMFGGCFAETPPLNPSSWGVDAFVAVKPK
ncbi:MAG: hypothetical protein ABL973_16925 [Micropepsaceae bacterium]